MIPPPRIEISVRSVGWMRGGPLASHVRRMGTGTLAGKTRVLLLVHGYNNDERTARNAYDSLLNNLGEVVQRAFDCVVDFQWPGDSYSGKAIGAAMYPRQIETARQAAKLL